VVAPSSTIDLNTECGADIEIEKRDPSEILCAPGLIKAGATAWNPVFDITPAELVDVLVTELGVVHRPDQANLARLLNADI
jgi:methylthioribose-1-phosphate isomerase